MDATKRDPMNAEQRDPKPDKSSGAEQKIKVVVDPELSLDARISQLEEAEVLRISIYQAQLEVERCVESGDIDGQREWEGKLKTGQKKLGQTLSAISACVRRRLDAAGPRIALGGGAGGSSSSSS